MTAAEHVAESRASQGLPERITDPTALARIATLLAAGVDRPAEGVRHVA